MVEEEYVLRLRAVEEQLDQIVRVQYEILTRTALAAPNKRLVIGIANRVALEKFELLDAYTEEIFYKHSRSVKKSKLPIDEESDIVNAQFLAWHLLQTQGKMKQDEIGVEYGYVSFVKHTHKKMADLQSTTTGRAIVAGAEARFKEELDRCLADTE